MALIKCTECGHMISDKAKACPKCGCPVETMGEVTLQGEESFTDVYNTNAYNGQYPENSPKKPGKTLIIAICAVVAVVAVVIGILFVWGGNSANHEGQHDSVAAADQAQDAEQQRIKLLYANFITPDLSTFQVRGYVKNISMKMLDINGDLSQYIDLLFDTEGSLTNASTSLSIQTSPARFNMNVIRSGKYIRSMSFANTYYGGESGVMTFEYNQGLLNKYVYTYESNSGRGYDMYRVDVVYSDFNRRGLPANIDFHDAKCGFGAHAMASNYKVYSTFDTQINYTKFDEYGNWTELILGGTRISRDKDGLTGVISEAHPSSLSTVITRNINYYTPEEIFGKD